MIKIDEFTDLLMLISQGEAELASWRAILRQGGRFHDAERVNALLARLLEQVRLIEQSDNAARGIELMRCERGENSAREIRLKPWKSRCGKTQIHAASMPREAAVMPRLAAPGSQNEGGGEAANCNDDDRKECPHVSHPVAKLTKIT